MSKSLVAEYQAQPWIMEPMALKAFGERIAAVPESAEILSVEVAAKQSELKVTGGIARIAIEGYLLDRVPGWMRIWGIRATAYGDIVTQINEAASRKDVTGIELVVDSPGGMVAGVIGAADAIYNARAEKPVTATVNNLSASGAYWLTSQAAEITAADANTLAGSIGVYTWYVDWTKFEEKMGVKVIVIRSGEYKGMGLDSITENQITAVQEYIDATAANFISQVARGRRVSTEKIAESATGQLWIAARAKELGLIDSVTQSAVPRSGAAVAKENNSSEIKEIIMKDQQEQIDAQIAEQEKKLHEQDIEAARLEEKERMAELQAAFPDDIAFATDQFIKGHSVAEAKAEYCDVLREKLKTKTAEHSTQHAEQATTGSPPIATDDTDAGTEGDFMAEARELAEEKKISVTAAMKKLARSKPELHQAFLGQCQSRGRDMYAEAG